MSRYRVVAVGRAQRHIAAISAWWAQNRLAAPTLFDDELAEAGETLASAPLAGTPYRTRALPGVRRFLLLRSRYHLYYTLDEDAAVVLVREVWHASRGSRPRLR